MAEHPKNTDNSTGLKSYIAKNMLIGIALAIFVIILFKLVLGFFESPGSAVSENSGHQIQATHEEKPSVLQTAHLDQATQAAKVDLGQEVEKESEHAPPDAKKSDGTESEIHTQKTDQPQHQREEQASHSKPAISKSLTDGHSRDTSHDIQATVESEHPTSHDKTGEHAEDHHGMGDDEIPSYPVTGMAFVDAVIKPLDFELNQRFYGWRPNDILNFTDNVNNFQLGVLEVTRRTSIILAERISRTGSTAAFEPNLENAMNWFMIKADRYWFPSAESKYKASLQEIRNYFYKLERGEANFYTRTDNLIPLLKAYQDLLGSCDENLVKSHEDDGSPVSYFQADNYFFYAKGVASAMLTILKGVERDFSTIMLSREGAMEVLHHAIESCHHAVEVDPWLILNSDLDSVFANHRLNMAAPISHARFYLGVLIRTLST